MRCARFVPCVHARSFHRFLQSPGVPDPGQACTFDANPAAAGRDHPHHRHSGVHRLARAGAAADRPAGRPAVARDRSYGSLDPRGSRRLRQTPPLDGDRPDRGGHPAEHARRVHSSSQTARASGTRIRIPRRSASRPPPIRASRSQGASTSVCRRGRSAARYARRSRSLGQTGR